MNELSGLRRRVARRLALTLASLAPVASCGPDTAGVTETATDVAVYAAALDSLFAPRDSAPPRSIVVLDSTTDFHWNASDTTLMGDFVERAPISLLSIESALDASAERPFAIAADSVLARLRQSRDSTAALLKPEEGFRRVEIFWQLFYERFPKTAGFASLSAIGYGNAGSEAIVYVQHSCGGLCGNGSMVRLKRQGDRWRVVSIQELWVS